MQNSAHHSPLERYFYGVQHWNRQFFTLPLPYQFKIAKFQPPLPTDKIFQRGPNTGIVNFANCYYLMSSTLQNSGHHSPLEWYFNGDQTLALPILNIPMALRFQNSGHHSPLEWYFKTLAFPILHISMASWVQSCKIPATVVHWNDISLGFNHCHYQLFTFL